MNISLHYELIYEIIFTETSGKNSKKLCELVAFCHRRAIVQ